MKEGVDFTVSYAPVAGICSLQIIISIASAEGLILFVLDISNAFQNIIYYLTLQKESILDYHIYTWIGIKENVQNIN